LGVQTQTNKRAIEKERDREACGKGGFNKQNINIEQTGHALLICSGSAP
jgi:hypothetical protein